MSPDTSICLNNLNLLTQDVSGIMTIWMKVMSSRIKKMIQFMKAVPGFSNLSTGDQIILFKGQ